MKHYTSGITARPYQLLCAICAIGQGLARPENDKVRRLLEAVQADPDVPVTLRCNAGIDSLFGFQDPGPEADTPEGTDYNQKRDFDILHRLDLSPGVTLPARILLMRVFDRMCVFRPAGRRPARGWRGDAADPGG